MLSENPDRILRIMELAAQASVGNEEAWGRLVHDELDGELLLELATAAVKRIVLDSTLRGLSVLHARGNYETYGSATNPCCMTCSHSEGWPCRTRIEIDRALGTT